MRLISWTRIAPPSGAPPRADEDTVSTDSKTTVPTTAFSTAISRSTPSGIWASSPSGEAVGGLRVPGEHPSIDIPTEAAEHQKRRCELVAIGRIRLQHPSRVHRGRCRPRARVPSSSGEPAFLAPGRPTRSALHRGHRVPRSRRPRSWRGCRRSSTAEGPRPVRARGSGGADGGGPPSIRPGRRSSHRRGAGVLPAGRT